MLIFLPVVYSECLVSSTLVPAQLGGIYSHVEDGLPWSLLENPSEASQELGPTFQALARDQNGRTLPFTVSGLGWPSKPLACSVNSSHSVVSVICLECCCQTWWLRRVEN